MAIPKRWGQGQLFAFSALDGESLAGDDFVGTLSGDRIGIRFYTKVKRELAIVNAGKLKPTFSAVTCDLILMDTKEGEMCFLYPCAHTVIGKVVPPAVAVVLTEGIHQVKKVGEVEIHDTGDGEFTALYRKEDRFSFAFGKTETQACERARLGIKADLEAVKQEKLAFFEKHSLPEDAPFADLYGKFLSVMKSQLYSPQGFFKRIWSTPDRLPHKRLWLWDSVFHAIGFRNLSPALAQDLILAALDCQRKDGFIPHMATFDKVSRITQPPVLAWGAYLVYERSGDKAFLKEVFLRNRKFLLWFQENRRDTREELYTWLTLEKALSRGDESGMDNSPRFDLDTRLQAIDLSCFMANDVRFMARIARELGEEREACFFGDWYETIKTAINEKLWCEKDRFYYDFDRKGERLHKVRSVASFLPLFAGVCDEEKAAALAEHLQDPKTFSTPFSIPSLSKEDPSYGSDMWRGPVWINYNYMILQGLQEYGFGELCSSIRDNTLSVINEWYQKTGVVFEFYDPENKNPPSRLNRKGEPFEPYDFTVGGQAIRDFGWSCTLGFDLLHNRCRETKEQE